MCYQIRQQTRNLSLLLLLLAIVIVLLYSVNVGVPGQVLHFAIVPVAVIESGGNGAVPYPVGGHVLGDVHFLTIFSLPTSSNKIERE